MFDLDKFKAKASAALAGATRTIRIYTPETFSAEKQYINAMVSSIALIIVADRKVETEEVTAGISFIQSLNEIKELNKELESIEMFDHIINDLMQHIDNEVKWIIEVSKIIANISLVRTNPAYTKSIKAVLEHIAGVDGDVDQTEVDMKNKIMEVLK